MELSGDERLLADPYLRPMTSRRSRVTRGLWLLVWAMFGRHSPRPAFAWRAALLRLFGARLGSNCHVYPRAAVWAPWNLVCADAVAIADGAVIYNAARISLGSHCVISQDAYLCGATHALDDPAFTWQARPIEIGAYAWICARASVGPGVRVGDGAVLGLGAVTARDLAPWTVHAGNPAREIRPRRRFAGAGEAATACGTGSDA
jgi:putative colanic acid biosynthesis acetyltransferase WcaF